MSDLTKAQEEWRVLLRARLIESDLSATKFATDVLMREPRTMRRWLAGDSPIPVIVGDWLREPAPRPWPVPVDG